MAKSKGIDKKRQRDLIGSVRKRKGRETERLNRQSQKEKNRRKSLNRYISEREKETESLNRYIYEKERKRKTRNFEEEKNIYIFPTNFETNLFNGQPIN